MKKNAIRYETSSLVHMCYVGTLSHVSPSAQSSGNRYALSARVLLRHKAS